MIPNLYIDTENRHFYDTIKDFSYREAFPGADERYLKSEWNQTLWKKMGEQGFLGVPLPEEYGGQGGTCLQSSLALEGFVAGCLDNGFALSWGAHMIIGSLPILFHGTDAQKNKYLPKFASGEWIAGFALTEPDSGSDAASMRTFAEPVSGGYKLNGSKLYITNGPVGQTFVVMARTTKSRGPMGISAFIVDSNTKGFQVSKVLKKIGHSTSMTAELSFEDMIVPEENLLGPLHSGFVRIGRSNLEWERTVLVAGNLGGMEFALEHGMNFAKNRIQFGKSISEFYGIQEKLIKDWIYLNLCRRYLYYVANAKDAGHTLPLESSLIKLLASEVGEELASEAVQLQGGMGFMTESHIGRMYLDAKLGTIGGGTSEIQRSIISSMFTSIEKVKANLRLCGYACDSREYPEIAPIVSALESLVDKCAQHPERKKRQSLEFAFADAVMLWCLLQISAWDSARELPGYSKSLRKNDLKLLTHYLLSKYIRSIQNLSYLEPKISKEIFDLYFSLGQDPSWYKMSFEFLAEELLKAA